MTVSKLSEIATSTTAPASTDTLVGVHGGTVDYQYTLSQIQSAVGGGSPGGASGDVQFNSGSGGFVGDANLNWDDTDAILYIATANVTVDPVGGDMYFGIGAGNTPSLTGGSNIGIGSGALAGTTGANNIAIGFDALTGGAGNNNLALGKFALASGGVVGQNNFALGTNALESLINGENNIAVGINSLINVVDGSDNIAIGSFAGSSITSGLYNTIIGKSCDTGADVNGAIVIGTGDGTTQIDYNLTQSNVWTIPGGKGLRLGNAYVGTPVVPTGYVELYDSTGTLYKIPAVAA